MNRRYRQSSFITIVAIILATTGLIAGLIGFFEGEVDTLILGLVLFVGTGVNYGFFGGRYSLELKEEVVEVRRGLRKKVVPYENIERIRAVAKLGRYPEYSLEIRYRLGVKKAALRLPIKGFHPKDIRALIKDLLDRNAEIKQGAGIKTLLDEENNPFTATLIGKRR